jgi:predicted house-cleaning NTP pyrophosphatase (Maf/HAM1 superfamily)
LIACEDSTDVRLRDKDGNDVTSQKVRTYVQDLTVKHVGGGWKIADVATTVVKSFEGQPCAA